MGKKQHFTVVRNQGYTAKEFRTRQRHNERQNDNYHNGDIIAERSVLNHHYKKNINQDGDPETYKESFYRMIGNGEVVKRGLKLDAKVFAELVFDVNSAYFDGNGGYEYAKKFFAETYKLAVKEVGGELYILSAVLHADERNTALSEEHGRDIFHYHLHVVYIPVVEKKVYYRKDMKNKEKAGKLKEVIPQISHSKKWPIKVPVERDGKTYFVNSYSLLQDRYFEHMKAAGFDGFERGERGSTAEHLDVLDYKIKQDTIRAGKLECDIEEIEDSLAELDKEVEKKEARLDRLDEIIKVKNNARATIREVDAMGKPAMFGGYTVTSDDLKKLKTLAKKSVTISDQLRKAKGEIEKTKLQMTQRCAQLEAKISEAQREIASLRRDRDTWKRNYDRLWAEVREFIGAIRRFPNRLRAFVASLTVAKSQNREVSL